MNAMNKIIFLFFALFLLSPPSFANVRYSPAQLQQFETTGSCQNCDLTDVTFLFVNAGVQSPFNLEGANLSGSFINTRNNTLSNFSGITAVNTSFSNNCYSQANFKNAILIDANFMNSNLTYSDFTGANVTGVSFADSDLYGAKGIDFSSVASVCGAIMPDGSKGACK